MPTLVLSDTLAEVRLHVPFEVTIEGCGIEIVEEVHTPKTKIPASVKIEVAIDLAVIRLDEITLVVKPRPDAEVVATVGVGVRITILIDIRPDDFSSHAKALDNLTGVASVWSNSKFYPSRGRHHFLSATITFTDKIHLVTEFKENLLPSSSDPKHLVYRQLRPNLQIGMLALALRRQPIALHEVVAKDGVRAVERPRRHLRSGILHKKRDRVFHALKAAPQRSFL